MKRFLVLLLCSLLTVAPAIGRSLGTIAVTTAVSAQTTAALQVSKGSVPPSISVQCKFTYGSGGTSADAWVQTTLDGSTWTDIANCHFTTASARVVYNLSSSTPVTTQYVATDGTLSANTAKDGILGTSFRVKYTTVGTYAGSTTLAIDINGVPLAN
jgi:hypothetical protein